MEIREKINKTIISGVKSRAQEAARAAEEQAREVVNNPSPSAPGNPPGVRTGRYRGGMTGSGHVTAESARSVSVKIQVKNPVMVKAGSLAQILEHGNSRVAARPHFEKSANQAKPKVKEIFEAPYYG